MHFGCSLKCMLFCCAGMTRKGLCMTKGLFGGSSTFFPGAGIDRLLGENKAEVILYRMSRGQPISFPKAQAGQSSDDFIFLALQSGQVRMSSDSGERDLTTGEFVYFSLLEEHLRFTAYQDSTMLIFTNAGIYDAFAQRNDRIKQLVAQIKSKDGPMDVHLRRTSYLCKKIGERFNLSSSALTELNFAAYFHDLGKLRIPDSILKKPIRLNPEEYQVIKQHVQYSQDIFLEVFSDHEKTIDCQRIAKIIGQHHERLDGSGYPDRLTAQYILQESRILAVVDAYDAMITDRGYSPAMAPLDAIAELYREPSKYDIAVIKELKRFYMDIE
ncbi:MAG: HD domain-containing protein, partial [Spirochaetes bacterium]|nr:HD domain-containing protein [Spirochaetota bacterium]